MSSNIIRWYGYVIHTTAGPTIYAACQYHVFLRARLTEDIEAQASRLEGVISGAFNSPEGNREEALECVRNGLWSNDQLPVATPIELMQGLPVPYYFIRLEVW